MAEIEILNSVINAIDSNTKKPEQFLSVQENIAVNLKNSIKQLYDFTKEQSQRSTNALPELVTEGFDEEQIWQQLELQNESELDYLINGVSKALAESKGLTIPVTTTKPEPVRNEVILLQDEVDKEEEEEEDEGGNDEEKVAGRLSQGESSEDEKEMQSNLKRQKDNEGKRKKKSSIVDDKFFKLEELDEYLIKEERKEKENDKHEQGSDDESVDLFNDLSDEDDKKDEEKLFKYADFFDNPHSEDDDPNDSAYRKNKGTRETDHNESLTNNSDLDNEMDIDSTRDSRNSSAKKKVTFNLTNDSDDTDSLEYKNTSVEEGAEVKSSLEMRQERLKNRIQQLEQESISEKPWQLKGEVSASNRPQNSLLEEFVEFDVTTRPAPVITEQTTLKLEDIIKQRIKDKAWDDVEKKFKPVETPLEYKKKLILDQEKSKESLSQVYENEYLKQKQALNPDNNEKEEEEPKMHSEIREMMHSVFSKLDALSNFHYTPKHVKPEIKVISNVPAINMEEVAPMGMSDAALLAPEEIQAKPRGDVIGKAERTKTDMKRERRRKKVTQRARQEVIEKKEKLNALIPGVAKRYKKEKNAQLAKKLSKSRNIIQMEETSLKVPKSSTTFFNQLQDQVKSHIKAKTSANSKKKQKGSLSAVKLKL